MANEEKLRQPEPEPRPHAGSAQLVPIEQLVDLESLREGGREPSLQRLRAALPPGWVLQADGRSARRDLRVLARDGWVLLTGLVCFGAVAIGLFRYSLPRDGAGLWTLALLVGSLILVSGLVGPLITKALMRR